MRLKLKTFIALATLGALSSFTGCHGNSSNPSANPAQPGTSAQNSTAITQKCDSLRMDLRKTAMGFLGISALQVESDKIMKELSPNDLKTLVSLGVEYRAADTTQATQDNDFSDMSEIIRNAAKQARIDDSAPTIIPGTDPVREVDIGIGYYIDPSGNFTIGQAGLQKVTGIQVNDIIGAVLAVGLDQDPTKSFQTYTIGLFQITDASDASTNLIPLSTYIETQLPAYCQNVSALTPVQKFNLDKIPVGASN